MPRNFDDDREKRIAERRARWAEEGRDRSFVLGGEMFEYAEFIPDSAFMALVGIGESTSRAEVWQNVHRSTALMVELGETDEEREATLARWRSALDRVEYADVQAVAFWILEEHLGRPTSAPSPSGERRETTGNGSTEDSSSDQAASAASTG